MKIESQNIVNALTTTNVEFSVDLRIFPPQVIERVIHTLSDQITEISIEESLSNTVSIRLQFLSPGFTSEEICDIFHAKLISASVMINSFEKKSELLGYFAQSAHNVTTDVHDKIKAESLKYDRLREDQIKQ